MKILYLHQYYKTNTSGGGTRSFEFASYLSENGMKIQVITGTELDRVYYEKDDIYVYSTSTKYNNKMSKWRRILAFADYNIKALIKGINTKQVDIIFATSTPLTIGFPAVLLAKLKRIKLIFEVRDVWPDIPIELGYIKNKYIIRILKAYELWIYSNSKHIIVLSKGMYDNLVSKGINSKKITIIENMANLYMFNQNRVTKREFEIEDKFVCIHPGTMGHVNGLDFLLDVAKIILEKDNEIVFLLIGEGNQKVRLKKRVEKEQLTNVMIKDSLPKTQIVDVIKYSDVGIMCVDNNYKILEDNSANKFFDFLSAGLPILINYAGWQKEEIELNNCGKSALEPSTMASLILELKSNQVLRKVFSENSRSLAETKYSDTIAKKKLLEVINNI